MYIFSYLKKYRSLFDFYLVKSTHFQEGTPGGAPPYNKKSPPSSPGPTQGSRYKARYSDIGVAVDFFLCGDPRHQAHRVRCAGEKHEKGETASRDPTYKARLPEVAGLTLYSRDNISMFINLNIVPNFETNIMETHTIEMEPYQLASGAHNESDSTSSFHQ
jgi:hypothetical protein